MKSLSKKCLLAFLAVLAGICMLFGFLPAKTSQAAAGDVVLNSLDHFDATLEGTSYTIKGLKPAGEEAIGSAAKFSIDFTGLNVATIKSDTEGQSFLGNTYASKLQSVTFDDELVSIEADAFRNCSALTAVDLSPCVNLTQIGDNAFSVADNTASALASITIPTKVTSIGKNAFAGHSNLGVINFFAKECANFSVTPGENPFRLAGTKHTDGVTVNLGMAGNQVTKIPAYLFNTGSNNNGISTVNFVNVAFAATEQPATPGETLTISSFGSDAFNGCTKLKTVNFVSDAIGEIGIRAFSGCKALESFNVPANVELIGDGAFNGCSALNALSYATGSKLTKIGSNAFANTGLQGVTFPDSTAGITIGGSAFANCPALTTVNITKDIKSIGSKAFTNCPKLANINYSAISAGGTNGTTSPFADSGSAITLTIAGDSVNPIKSLFPSLFRKTNITTATLSYVDTKAAGGSFGYSMFEGCTKLESVTFTNCNIAYVNNDAFKGCSSLRTVKLPASIAEIYPSTFEACTSLHTVNLNELTALTTIGDRAFFGDVSLYTVTLPASLKETTDTIGKDGTVPAICDDAFKGCTKLIEVYNKSPLTVVAGQTTNGCVAQYAQNVYATPDGSKISESNGYVVYTDGANKSLLAYTGSETALNLATVGVNSILAGAFKDNTNIVSISSAITLNLVGDFAFQGCTSLTTVSLTSVYDFGTCVFAGCTSLKTVVLPATGFNYIRNLMFDGCTALEEITIPASVQTIEAGAFKGCTSLTKVKFTPFSGSDYKLSKIDQSAFDGCTSLKMINIPASVSDIGGYAFRGCSALEVVYMPDSLTNYTVVGMFDTSATRLIIVPAASIGSYSANFSTLNYGLVTYEVDVYLVYGDNKEAGVPGSHEIVNKLYGLSSSYEKQSDGSWKKIDGSMPVQSGYASSVWYSSENCLPAEEVDMTTLTIMLNTTVQTINLYAKTMNSNLGLTVGSIVPEYSVGKNYSFDEIFSNYDAVFTAANPASLYKFTYTYVNVKGEAATVAAISDAGTYTISVNLDEEKGFGTWATAFEKQFVIKPMTIKGDEVFTWITKGGSALGGGELYFDKGGIDLAPYIHIEDSLLDGYNKQEVLNAYVVYSANTECEVVLDETQIGAYATISYENNKGTVANTYEAEATLVAKNNYTFTYTTTPANANAGVTWSPDPANSTFTVSKVWYIANPGNNALLTADNAVFSLPVLDKDDGTFGWNYGDAAGNVPAPKLAVTPDYCSSLITFKLYNYDIWPELSQGSEAPVHTYAEFTHVICSGMPAGDYTLEITVKGVEQNHVYYNETTKQNETYTNSTYSDQTSTIHFTVKPAALSSRWTNEEIHGNLYTTIAGTSAKASFTVEYNDKLAVNLPTPEIPVLALTESQVYPGRAASDYWKQAEFDSLYSGFSVTYGINGTSAYYTAKELESESVRPTEAGAYRIYFNVSAPNYEPYVDVTDARQSGNYYYNLYIKKYVNPNTILQQLDLTYNGLTVTFRDTAEYRFILLNKLTDSSVAEVGTLVTIRTTDYDYVNAGERRIAVKLTDTNSYRWGSVAAENATAITVFDDNFNGAYAVFNFTIKKATNSYTRALTVRDWVWGEFDPEVNRPKWNTVYDHIESHYDFWIIAATENGVELNQDRYYFSGENRKLFSDAPAGTYNLYASVPGALNYEEYIIDKPYTPVTISKATVKITNTPYIESWKYGSFNTYKAPVVKFADSFKDLETVCEIISAKDYDKWLVQDENIKIYNDIHEMLDEYQQVPAGSYVYIIKLADGTDMGDNFDDWKYEIRFSVLQTNNYWDITPSVHDWVYGDFTSRDNTLSYKPHYGKTAAVSVAYYRVDESGMRISEAAVDLASLGLDSEGELGVGRYEVNAKLAGNSNYTMLDISVYFIVSKADNAWTTDGIPSIESWSEGNWDKQVNALSATPVYGHVEFTIYSADDKDRANPLDINNLNALGVGSYILVARVAGNDNYEELVSESTFAVFEDAVALKGIIIPTIILAVVAIGLAVAGVVLLIIRNRKLEAEFSRMVKSELRRRK